jgi:hypothetical protein
MTKLTAITIGAVLTTAVAALVLMHHRAKIGPLRVDAEPFQEHRDQLLALAVENARLSNLVAQTIQAKASPDQATHEILRLRGEVGRLRRDLEDLRQVSNEEIDKLGKQARQPHDLSLIEIYSLSGIDTNSVPNIELGATTNDVMAELRRIGAKFLTTQDDYIHAEVFPTSGVSTPNNLFAIRMEFYFEAGRLTLRRDW